MDRIGQSKGRQALVRWQCSANGEAEGEAAGCWGLYMVVGSSAVGARRVLRWAGGGGGLCIW